MKSLQEVDYNKHLNDLMRNACMTARNPDVYGSEYKDWMLSIELPVDAKEFKKLGPSSFSRDVSNYLYRAFNFNPWSMVWISDRSPRAKDGIRTLHFNLYFKGESQVIGGRIKFNEYRKLEFKALPYDAQPQLEVIQGGAR